MSEQLYPIYRISAKWTEVGEKLPNSTSFDVMFPTRTGISTANQTALNWWEQYLDNSKGWNKDKPPLRERLVELLEISGRFLEKESWCSGWFQHYTLNTHLSDSDINSSFHDFVQRKKQDPRHSLMGAADEWRWKICRCEHCQKRGIIMMNH